MSFRSNLCPKKIVFLPKLTILTISELLSPPITIDSGHDPPRDASDSNGRLLRADKLTRKWPLPRPSRSVFPWLCGLGVSWVGRWTLHKKCVLMTTVFLLGLTCLQVVFSLLTWFTGKSTIEFACLCGCDTPTASHISTRQLTL
jgi:hypothetical protein